jgi:site-specific DNA-methyltransferase (adenine-specific)
MKLQESLGQLDDIVDKVICGDAIDVLRRIPSNSIDLVITSPPYYKQREYGGIGIRNEKTVEEYIENLMKVFRECVRVTRSTGSIVYNIGDKYEEGSLLLVPYRFALEALKRENVKLVNEVTWVKINPTPKQDQKKLVPSKEPFFIFAKSKDYYFDKNSFLDYLNVFRKNGSKKASSNIGKKYFELIEKSDLTDDEKRKAKDELVKSLRKYKVVRLRVLG